LPGIPFKRIEEVPEDKIESAHSNHFLGKPLYFITSKRASCSTVSKALAKSHFRITIGFLEA
jgi:hypothetical protein